MTEFRDKSVVTIQEGATEKSDRRTFLVQSVGIGGALLLGRAATDLNAEALADDLVARMKWMNEPASVKNSGGSLTVRSRPKTDFWRKTFYGYITDNGHFLHMPVSGDFTFEARVNGKYSALYDQAGLMVRVDAANWVKCGTEFVDGVRHASVVFTRDFSDWSTMTDLSKDAPVWWRAVRTRDALETLCSVDGKNYMSVRQGYLVSSATAEVGIMCAAPEGAGFDAVFDNLKLDQSKHG